jgi:peptidoglycan/xylan/chitin deacetylase (PgdA/CDA1 family)
MALKEWPGGARLAMSYVVNVEEGAEMSVAEGDKGPEPVDELGVALKIPIRNFGNESNYVYGLRAGAPRVLGLLGKHGAKATFTAAAVALERAPDLARAIAAGRHEACSHGWRWVHQFSMKGDAERAFVRKAVVSIEASTGARPVGWLSRYLHTPALRATLAEEGFLYHMDDYSDDVPRWDVVETAAGPRAIVIVPYALDTNDMKFWLAPGYTPQQWLDYAVATFDCLHEEAKDAPRMMSLGLHLRIIGRPGRIGALDRFMQHVASRRGVWVATRADIARAFARAVAPPAEAAAA